MKHVIQYLKTTDGIFVLLSFLLLFSGCTTYVGERVIVTPEMRQEIDSLSTDQALQAIRDHFKAVIDAKASYITLSEWEQKKRGMQYNTKTGYVRDTRTGEPYNGLQPAPQGAVEFVDGPRRKVWYGCTVSETAVEYHHYYGGQWTWGWRFGVTDGISAYHQQWWPPKTTIGEYRFSDIVELRTSIDGDGLHRITLYSRVKAKTGSSMFWFNSSSESKIRTLTLAFLKLCPKVKVDRPD